MGKAYLIHVKNWEYRLHITTMHWPMPRLVHVCIINFVAIISKFPLLEHITAEKRMLLPELEIPFWEIFKTIVILLGIPLLLGILCSQYLPKVTNALKKPMQYL
jgi:ACR3 family arsenite efflux pump ArsB